MQKTHSEISGSNLERVSKCPGSVAMCRGIPEAPSIPEAERGTLAHEMAESLLVSDGYMDNYILTEEEKSSVFIYIKYVKNTFENMWTIGRGSRGIERPFCFTEKGVDFKGTIDCAFWDFDTKYAEIIDYKHGAGIPVEVVNNKQLLFYALGWIKDLNCKPEKIRLTIVQPRREHPDGLIRHWDIDIVDLYDFEVWLNELIERIYVTGDTTLNPGDHCKFCPAAQLNPETLRPYCAALDQKVSIVDHLETFFEEKIVKYLDAIPHIESWIKKIRAYAFNTLKDGQKIDGFKLVEKKPRLQWKKENPISQLLDIWPVNLQDIQDHKLKNPHQIEKLLETPEQKQKLRELCTYESSGYTLVSEHDKRPAITNIAQFTAITYEDEA